MASNTFFIESLRVSLEEGASAHRSILPWLAEETEPVSQPSDGSCDPAFYVILEDYREAFGLSTH